MTEAEGPAPLVTKSIEGLLRLTPEGKNVIAPLVTSVGGQVYAFTPEANTTWVAGAMARLSRNPNDLRTIIANEFVNTEDGAEKLLQRVVTAYGDDSVMQLGSMQLVLEGISNLATKAVERGRLAAYLEQSTRYLRFDRRDEDGRYRYFTPSEFDIETAAEYEKGMDAIFDVYSELYVKVLDHIKKTSKVPEEERDAAWRNACHAKACDSVRGLLPAATKATVGVSGSIQAIYNMILRLESEPLPELKDLGRQALIAARIINPVFFERIDVPDRGGLISSNKEETRTNTRLLAQELVEQHGGIEQETGAYVRLLGVEGSEDELIAKILTDSSDYSYESLLDLVRNLTHDQKEQVITTYVGERHNRRVKPGRAFELPNYLFEVQCDFGAFRDIQRHRMVDGFEWQRLQPRLGHDRPSIINEAGLADDYECAFGISQNLYAMLQARGYEEQAQYATLFGHNMRFSFKINARSLVHSAELRTTPQGHPAYRKVYQEMVAAVERHHPFIVRIMTFLNQDEDPELARLGAERAAQRRAERVQ